MGSKKSAEPELPVLGGLWRGIEDAASGPPTVDQAREGLGGPWQGGAGVGETVAIAAGRLGTRVGVVVHGGPTERDVWIGGGRIQRVAAGELRPVSETSDAGLAAIADDARVHAALREGQRVAYVERDGASGEGVLAEKLRYGSLVGLDDGRLIAVSFRRVGPAEDGDPS